MNKPILESSLESSRIKRIIWLDVSRGIAFLMVIYSHLDYRNSEIMKFFYPVFLTTFFFVSGYLYKSGSSFSRVLEHRTRSLLLPLFALGSIMIVMQHLFTFKSDVVSWKDSFKGLLLQNGENELLWFVAALYIYSILFFWVEKYSGKWLLLVSILLFVGNWIYRISFPNAILFWHLNCAGYGCAYMGFGKVYKLYEACTDRYVKIPYCYMAFVLYILLILFSGKTCNFFGSRYLWDSILLTSLGLFIIVYLSKGVSFLQNWIVIFVGSNSLFYFAFHGKAYALWEYVADKCFASFNLNHSILIDTLSGFIIVVLVVLTLIVPAKIVNRYFPFLLGRGFRLWY